MDIDRKILVQAVREAAERTAPAYADDAWVFTKLADDIENGRAAKMDTWIALDAIRIALKTEWKPE